MIPRGETVNVTFWSFFPLALAWKEEERERGSVKATERRGLVSEKEISVAEFISCLHLSCFFYDLKSAIHIFTYGECSSKAIYLYHWRYGRASNHEVQSCWLN